MKQYDSGIDKEGYCINWLKRNNIIQRIWNCNVATWWPDNSVEQTIKGWDFTLENGLNIDLKSQLGKYRNGYYTKVCISVERKQNGIWKNCALSKETDLWLIPTQVAENKIEIYSINRRQMAKIEQLPDLRIVFAGGKWQKIAILPFDSPLVTKLL